MRLVLALTSEDHYHPSLDITVFIDNLKQKPHKFSNKDMVFNFKEANFVGLCRELTEANFAFLNDVDDVNVAVSLFDNMLRDIVTTGERIFVGVFKLVMTRGIVSLSRGRRTTVIVINKYIEY